MTRSRRLVHTAVLVPLALIVAAFALTFGGCGADGPTHAEDATPIEAAVFPVNTVAMKTFVWRYYLGYTTIAEPSMNMAQPDISCSPQPLGNNQFAYRIGKAAGFCLPGSGAQVQQAPYSFYATYEIWQDRVPAVQQPWYATLAVPFLCQAAYESVGYSYAQAYPYCSGSASSTVPTVRRLIHDTYYAGQPFWQ